MKRRKGFGKININGEIFQFNWADNPDGPMLVMYDKHDKKLELSYEFWCKYDESDEYKSKLDSITLKGNVQYFHHWHGKHKRGPEWGGWGKREAREMYRKYLSQKYEH
jgi:hypothetical protein